MGRLFIKKYFGPHKLAVSRPVTNNNFEAKGSDGKVTFKKIKVRNITILSR